MSDELNEQQQLEGQDPEETIAAAIRFCRIVYERQRALEQQVATFADKMCALDGIAQEQQTVLRQCTAALHEVAGLLAKGRTRPPVN